MKSQRSSVVEQSFHKRSVTGSIPVVGTMLEYEVASPNLVPGIV